MKKMRLIPAAIVDAAVLLKANLSGWYMLLALLFFSLFMSGCDLQQDNEPETFVSYYPKTDYALQANLPV